MNDSVRRSVSIPIVSNGQNILAVSEVGAKLWSKDIIYRKFFEHGLKGVEDDIKAEIKRRGGSDKDFDSMLNQANGKLRDAGLLPEVKKKEKKKKQLIKIK